MKKILVFFGGNAPEHDVSIVTGVMTTNCIGGEYEGVPIYVARDGKWYTGDVFKDLSAYKNEDFKKAVRVALFTGDDNLYAVKKGKLKKLYAVYCAINCMHGRGGEDGTTSSIIRAAGIPFASPGTFSSAVSMDKYYTKIALMGLGVEELPFVKLGRGGYFSKKESYKKFVEEKIGYPVILKPANLGSSIGVTLVKSEDGLIPALDEAFRYDEKVIAEKALENFREMNCACYRSGGKFFVSEVEEPITKNDVLTFDDKYNSAAVKKFPADIPKEISDKIKATTLSVYRKLEFCGIIRIDYLLKDGEVYLNEINSVPGSLAYYLFCKDTEEFSELLEKLIEEGVNEHNKYKANEFSYGKGFLSADFAKGSKGKR